MRDVFWKGASIGCGHELLPWLHDHGSLTQRIQQRCKRFEVRPVRSGLEQIAYDEAGLLRIKPQQLAYSREVFLVADGVPVVFAHSTCAAQHLRRPWSALAGLGNRPLGAMLFSHPLVRRQPLHFKLLRHHHALFQQALPNDKSSLSLWARRSIFELHQAPLLVTEVFLPNILNLPQAEFTLG